MKHCSVNIMRQKALWLFVAAHEGNYRGVGYSALAGLGV